MSPERFRALIDGVLAFWQADAQVSYDPDALHCRVERDGGVLVEISRSPTPLGEAWRVEATGRVARTHLSVVPALTTLREAVAPGRPRARVLFANESPDEDGQGS